MLDRSLTYHLSAITEDAIGNANHIFEMRFGWNVRELRVLRLVRATPSITFTALAALTKFERSLTSRILSSLIKAGLIERTNSTDDARIFTLKITAEGETLCRNADPLTVDLETLMLKPLAEKEREAFLLIIDRIRLWVQQGYIQELSRRYPELKASRRRVRALKPGIARPQSEGSP
jgi:DNA-binding MarR family transcriptional regulator